MGGLFFWGGGIRSQKKAGEFLFSFLGGGVPLRFLKKKLTSFFSSACLTPAAPALALLASGADESISELSADCSESQARRPAARSGAEGMASALPSVLFGAAAAATSAELDTTAASAMLCGCSKVASPSFDGGLSLLGGTATVETKKER